jgi:hypothetical protein
MAYLAVIGRRILSNYSNGGKFIFDGWGYNLLHSEGTVLSKFMEHGFRLCHNEAAVSAMMLADDVKGWNVYGANAALSAPTQGKRMVAAVNRSPWLKRRLIAVLDRLPWLKQRVVRTLALPTAQSAHIGDFKWKNPLSQELLRGLAAVMAQAINRETELSAFLNTHFSGSPPQPLDEAFFDLIGTKC